MLSVGERREGRRGNEGVKEEGEEKRRRRGGREGEKERGDKKEGEEQKEEKKGEERGEEGGDSYLIPVVLFPIWTGWLQNSLPTRSAGKTGHNKTVCNHGNQQLGRGNQQRTILIMEFETAWYVPNVYM